MPSNVEITIRTIDQNTVQTAKNIQSGMDAMSKSLKEAGVSQSAYNQALKLQQRAAEDAAKSNQKQRMSLADLKAGIDLVSQALQTSKKFYDFAKEGAQIEFTAQKFDRLAATIGTTGDALQDKLIVATRGTLSEMEAMASATDLISLGLVKTEGDAVRLSAVVAGLGMDMNQLVLALSNQTTMRFDQLGVAVVGFDEKVKSLTDSGMDAQDAFTEAFLRQAEEQLKKVGHAADTSYGQFLQFEAATKDLKTEFNQFAAALATPALPGFIKDLKSATWQVQNFADIWDEMLNLRGELPWKMGGLAGLIQFTNLQGEAEANVRAHQAALEQQSAVVEVSKNRFDEMNTVMAENVTVTEMTAEQVKAISDSNQMFVGVLGNVGSAMDNYYAGLAEAKTALDAGSISTEEHRVKVSELAAQYEQAKNQIVLSIVEMKLASDGWTNEELNAYLAVGQQLGAFTQDQIAAATGAIAMADAMIEAEEPIMHVGERGKDAQEGLGEMADGADELANSLNQSATPAAAALARTIDSIPNKTVHVYIKVHGDASFLGPGANTTTTNEALEELRDDTGGGRAAGGPLNAGGWTLVGDAPGGRLTPYSELITPNGYVLDAATTRKLFASGVMPDFTSMAFGGQMNGPTVRRGYKGPPGTPPGKNPSAPKTPNKDEDEETNASTFASDAATETAAFLAPTLQSAASAQQQTATASNEIVMQQQRTNTLLQNLIDAQPSTLERYNEATFGQSLNS